MEGLWSASLRHATPQDIPSRLFPPTWPGHEDGLILHHGTVWNGVARCSERYAHWTCVAWRAGTPRRDQLDACMRRADRSGLKACLRRCVSCREPRTLPPPLPLQSAVRGFVNPTPDPAIRLCWPRPGPSPFVAFGPSASAGRDATQEVIPLRGACAARQATARAAVRWVAYPAGACWSGVLHGRFA